MNPRRVRLLMWKEFTQLRRDPLLIRLLILMPVLQLLLFGYVVAVDISHIDTAVVDLDHTTVSRTIDSSFTASEYFNVTHQPATEADIRALMDSGAIQIAVVIPEGTQDALTRGDVAPIGLIVDGSDTQVSSVAGAYASRILASLNATRLADQGLSGTGPGLDARVRVEFNPTLDPINTMIPGLMAVIMMISLLAIMSQAVVKERESGTLEQMFVTPIRASEYLLGKVAPYALLATVQMLIVAVVGMTWFRVPFNGSWAVVITGLALFMLSCIGLGLFVSLMSRTRQQAQQAMVFIMLPFMILSGFIFPIASMPAWLQPVSAVIPLTYILEVLRGAFVKGTGFVDLARPLIALAVFAVVILGAAIVAMRRRITD